MLVQAVLRPVARVVRGLRAFGSLFVSHVIKIYTAWRRAARTTNVLAVAAQINSPCPTNLAQPSAAPHWFDTCVVET